MDMPMTRLVKLVGLATVPISTFQLVLIAMITA